MGRAAPMEMVGVSSSNEPIDWSNVLCQLTLLLLLINPKKLVANNMAVVSTTINPGNVLYSSKILILAQ